MTVETTKRLPCPTCGTSAADLNRRVQVENRLIRASKGTLPLPTAEECLQLALKLGIPEDFPREPVAASRLEAISEAEPVAWAIRWAKTGQWFFDKEPVAEINHRHVKDFEQRPLVFAHTPPAGHVVVPVEPTQEMIDAAYLAQPYALNLNVAVAYRAMLAARPQP